MSCKVYEGDVRGREGWKGDTFRNGESSRGIGQSAAYLSLANHIDMDAHTLHAAVAAYPAGIENYTTLLSSLPSPFPFTSHFPAAGKSPTVNTPLPMVRQRSARMLTWETTHYRRLQFVCHPQSLLCLPSPLVVLKITPPCLIPSLAILNH